MDRMLAETIAWREQQLNIVLESNNQKEATKWINRDKPEGQGQTAQMQGQTAQMQGQTAHGQGSQGQAQGAKLIKIGTDTTLDTTNIVDLKKPNGSKNVSFNLSADNTNNILVDNTDSNNSFLSMLKKEETTTDTLLKEILANQKLILQLLQKEKY